MRQNWLLLKDEIPRILLGNVCVARLRWLCTKALEILVPERQQPKKWDTRVKLRRPLTSTGAIKPTLEGEVRIRFKRVQRLWRRLQAFKVGDNNPNLGRAILREHLQKGKNRRIQQCKNKIVTDEKLGWKLVSRHKRVISSNCITTE